MYLSTLKKKIKVIFGLFAMERNSCWQPCSVKWALKGFSSLSLKVRQGAHKFAITNPCNSRSAQETKNNLRTRLSR